MKALRAPFFILSCLLFIIHQLMQKVLKINVPYVDDYLDNLLISPILLTFLLVERRVLFRKGSQYTLTVMEVVMATILITVVCELLFPYLSKDFITDWLDVVFYIAGSVLFFRTINFYRIGMS